MTEGGTVPTLNGEKVNVLTWWKKVFGICHNAKNQECLKEERDPSLPEIDVSEIDETTKWGKLAHIAVNKNDLAMASFAMAVTGEKAMPFICAASTPNWPEGEAHSVVLELTKRYFPLDTFYFRSRCKKEGILFGTLTVIQSQFLGPGNKLVKDLLSAIILDIAPEEYRAVLTVVWKIRGHDLTVEELEDAMNDEYWQLN
jgi:hypothetical protein